MANKKLHVLLVEDDKYFRLGIKDVLLQKGVVLEADNLDAAKELLNEQLFDIAIVDIHLGDDPLGLEVLKKAQSINLPCIVLSSSEDDRITEKAYELGCRHFLAKSHYRKHLGSYVDQISKNLGGKALEEFFKRDFLTKDKGIRAQLTQLSQINLKDKTLFIGGETGTGKSLIGKLIHGLNFPPEAPFVHINCSEIPENLIEAELFGSKKGSFTGADKDREGKLRLADGGILFLDEIATMPMSMQQKLLKALDEKTFYPVGSSKMEKSSFTLISATCEDLFEKVHKREFRKDLFFRISGINIELPPLRERPEDVPDLIKATLKKSPRRVVLKDKALEALCSYTWPGNARELIKTVEVLALKSKGIIELSDLPERALSQGMYSESEQTGLLTDSQKQYIGENGLKSFIKNAEEQALKHALKKNNGKVAQTIKDLGISSSAFYRIYESVK